MDVSKITFGIKIRKLVENAINVNVFHRKCTDREFVVSSFNFQFIEIIKNRQNRPKTIEITENTNKNQTHKKH